MVKVLATDKSIMTWWSEQHTGSLRAAPVPVQWWSWIHQKPDFQEEPYQEMRLLPSHFGSLQQLVLSDVLFQAVPGFHVQLGRSRWSAPELPSCYRRRSICCCQKVTLRVSPSTWLMTSALKGEWHLQPRHQSSFCELAWRAGRNLPQLLGHWPLVA